ncbi:MAG: lysylphosphatidylglycerol synthase transmembrane domain-containing protein [Porticoccaceae bacterium]
MGRMALMGWVIAILLLAALTGAVIRPGEIEHFAGLLTAAQPGWLLVALALQTGTYASEAAVWFILLDLVDHRQPLGRLIPLSLAKLFTDQAIPTGGLSGNLMVVEVLGHWGVAATAAISALVTGIIVYFLAYLAMNLLTLFVLWEYHVFSKLMIIGALILAAMAISLPILIFWIDRAGWPHYLHRLAATRPVAFALKAIGDAYPLIRRHPRHIGLAIVFQSLIFVLDGATLWATLQAIGQVASPMAAIAAFMVGSITASLGPFPLGLGGFEAACTSMLTLLSVPLEAAFTATFLLRGFTLWLPMLPGLWLLRREIRPTVQHPVNE